MNITDDERPNIFLPVCLSLFPDLSFWVGPRVGFISLEIFLFFSYLFSLRAR